VTSCLLAGLFESGVAVEPYNHSDLGFSGTLDLFDLLLRDFPALLPVKPRVARWDPRQQVDFRRCKVEELGLDKITNLWRVNDFVNLWQGLGFAVDVLSRKVRKAPPQRLHPSWNGYADEDLYCYTALIRARKQ